MGVLDAGNDLHLLVDEMADVGVVIDVEFDQQVVISSGGIDFGGDLGLGERIGDGIGLAKLAFELHEKRNHRCRLRKAYVGGNIAFSSEVDTGSREENASIQAAQIQGMMASELAADIRSR